ncbi:hypothetical protein JST97_25080 [bacterium]|nr:hypothetical protein [bacterium]
MTPEVAFFFCYPILPVAFYCGMGLLDGRPYGIFSFLYYILLLGSLWKSRRCGGWPAVWYTLAYALTWIHLLGVAGLLLGQDRTLPPGVNDLLFGLMLLTIPGVFVAACLAGAALAFRQNRPAEAIMQLGAPLLMASSVVLGSVPILLGFFGQGLHALSLSIRMRASAGNEELSTIGFSPES